MAVDLFEVRAVFERSYSRSEKLLELHRALHGQRGRPSRLVSDVVRSALLLSAASLDALLNSSLQIAAPEALRTGKLGPLAYTWAQKHDGLVDALGQSDPPHFLRRVVAEKLSNVTLQRPAAIEENLRGVLGCGPPWNRAVTLLQPEATDPRTLSEEWVVDQLKNAINRRHRIAHEADISPTARTPGAATPIRRQTVETWLWVIEKVGLATLDVIEDHLR